MMVGMGERSEAKVLYHEYGLQLRMEADDRLILNVGCGRILQYGVEFPLDSEEYRQYKREGDQFLKELAVKVQANPEAFAKRGRFC
jgi:hypothetical protein